MARLTGASSAVYRIAEEDNAMNGALAQSAVVPIDTKPGRRSGCSFNT
jgi:hypothetical protein